MATERDSCVVAHAHSTCRSYSGGFAVALGRAHRTGLLEGPSVRTCVRFCVRGELTCWQLHEVNLFDLRRDIHQVGDWWVPVTVVRQRTGAGPRVFTSRSRNGCDSCALQDGENKLRQLGSHGFHVLMHVREQQTRRAVRGLDRRRRREKGWHG